MLRRFLLLLAALAASCAMSPYQEGPTLGENPDLLGPDLDEEIRIGQFYLGPGDVVRLDVHKHEDLNRSAPVRFDGSVRLHLIGDVPISGMTLQQAETAIAIAYDRMLVDPSLILEVESWSSERKVTVLGHVARQSVLTLTTPRTSILEVIAQSGGVAPSGEKTGILIARRIEGVIQIRPYDMDLLFAPDDPAIRTEVPYVQPGDIIYVLRTWQDEFDSVMTSTVAALRAGTLLERLITAADEVVTVL